MQPTTLFFVLVLIGLLGGLIAGLVGIGGGTLYVFILPSVLAFLHFPASHSAQFTIANSFFAIFFASSAAVYALHKRNFFFPKPVLLIGGSALVLSFLTNYFIVLHTSYSKEEFNIIVIILLAFSMVYTLWNAKRIIDNDVNRVAWWKYSITGAVAGIIAALSGLGGGVVIIPVLNSLFGVDIKKASSISSGAIVISSFIIVVQNLFQADAPSGDVWSVGYIVFPVSLVLAVCVLISSPYGVKWSGRLPSKTISYIYASVLLLVILKKVIELL